MNIVIEITDKELREVYELLTKEQLINALIIKHKECRALAKPNVDVQIKSSNCIHCYEHILTIKKIKFKCKFCNDEKWEQLD